ncbi:hypothetical protein D3C81_2161060 [compost metagenome]
MAIIEISAYPQITKLFIQRDGIHFSAFPEAAIPIAGIKVFTHRHKILLRETIASEGNLAVVLVKTLGIADAV